MTTQNTTKTTVDEAFWDLVCHDPDLLEAEFRALVERGGPTPPGGRGGAGDREAHAERPVEPWPPDTESATPPARCVPPEDRGRVRSPP